MFALLKSGRLQVGTDPNRQTEKPPVCHRELSAAMLTVFLPFFTCSLFRVLPEQPERPGGLSSDDCHSEPRPGPQRSQQLLHTEVGQKTHVLIVHACVGVCRV